MNRYSSVTGWVRVLSEGLLCQWRWPEWHECLSHLETLLGQDKGVHLMSYLRWICVFFFFFSSSWYLNCLESRQGTTASIWSQFELLIKSQRWNREGHTGPRLRLKAIWLLMRRFTSSSFNFPDVNLKSDSHHQAEDSNSNPPVPTQQSKYPVL